MIDGMISGMTVKLTISLPDEVAERVRTAVQFGLAPSVSAYIAAALDEYGPAPTMKEVLDELDAETGPIPPEVQAWATAEMDRVFNRGNSSESA
jgi:Arc/MetJ-type ribon-helix-helix transcriptional regulator